MLSNIINERIISLVFSLFAGKVSQSTLTLFATDPIFGSVSWELRSYSVAAPNRTASILTVYILRGPGAVGRVAVYYK